MNEELIAAAEIGQEAKLFMESDLGKVILGIAEQEIALAQEALEEISPTDAEGIRQLQSQAKMGRNFVQWLQELFNKGENALDVFIQQERKE